MDRLLRVCVVAVLLYTTASFAYLIVQNFRESVFVPVALVGILLWASATGLTYFAVWRDETLDASAKRKWIRNFNRLGIYYVPTYWLVGLQWRRPLR